MYFYLKFWESFIYTLIQMNVKNGNPIIIFRFNYHDHYNSIIVGGSNFCMGSFKKGLIYIVF